MKLGLELATALMILCMFSFGLLAFVERDERAASANAVFRGSAAQWIGYAEFAALAAVAGPTLTGKFTGVIPVGAAAIALGFGYTALTHARWRHPLRATMFGLLCFSAALLAWGRSGSYAL